MTRTVDTPADDTPAVEASTSRGLRDDALTVRPPSRSIRAYLQDGADRLAGADPGLNQLRTALQAVLGIGVAVVLVDVFVRLTGALQLPAGAAPPAVVAATNHALLIVSMLMAGIVAMMAGFTVNDTTLKAQLVSTFVLPLPMLASLTLGLALGGLRVLSLVYLIVLLTAAVYVRRWGPRGFAAGLVAFNGGFLGFFLHAELGLRDVGWLAADVLVGVLASLLVRLTLLRPDHDKTLRRMRRSWDARARRLLELSADVLDTANARHRDAGGRDALHRDAPRERLRRQAVRLNESTLMIDAQLPEAVPDIAGYEAQRLFDAELALSNCARFAGALAGMHADPALRGLAVAALTALHDHRWSDADAAGVLLRAYRRADGATATGPGEDVRVEVLAHRLGSSVRAVAAAWQDLRRAVEVLGDVPASGYTPAIGLTAGFLPGSVPVSLAASTTPGRGGRLDHATLPPYLRGAIQMAVAATIAVVVGDLVSGYRLYWALLATFLAFMATTNSGEQVRKALFRVAGTALGIVVGDLFVHLTNGNIPAALAIVLVALFFGIYLIRVNYTFMVIGITVTMSQLYYQLGEFSWDLLLLRLAETAVGVGAVIVTVLVIVPLRPQRVLIAGTLLWFRSLSSLLDGSLDRLTGASGESLRPAIRAADAAWASLEATAVPLRGTTFGRNSHQLAEIRSLSAAARNYARSLANHADAVAPCTDPPALKAAVRDLRASVAAIDTRIETGAHGTYLRCASLLEQARTALAPCDPRLDLALRDLTLLDGTLARLATALHMDVRDHDTTAADLGVPTPA